jgi:hypothetical protein
MNLDELETIWSIRCIREYVRTNCPLTKRIDVLEVYRTFQGEVKNLVIYVMNGKDSYQHDLISTAIIILRLEKK